MPSFAVPVADIKAIVTGKDCPHMKEKSALKQNKVSGEAIVSLSRCHSDTQRGQSVVVAFQVHALSPPSLSL